MSTQHEVLSVIRGAEKAIDKNSPLPIPISSAEPTGPVAYQHSKEAPLATKARLADILSETKAEVQVPVTDEDVKRMKEKAQLATLWDFDKWVAETFLKGASEPARKAWLKKYYPEFFDRQIEAMKKLNDAKERYEKILIDQPHNLADLWFRYTYERDYEYFQTSTMEAQNMMLGLVKTEHGPESDAFELRAFTGNEAFQRGVWNSRKQFVDWAQLMGLDYARAPGVAVTAAQLAEADTQNRARVPVRGGENCAHRMLTHPEIKKRAEEEHYYNPGVRKDHIIRREKPELKKEAEATTVDIGGGVKAYLVPFEGTSEVPANLILPADLKKWEEMLKANTDKVVLYAKHNGQRYTVGNPYYKTVKQ
jgi:hypothetical protein